MPFERNGRILNCIKTMIRYKLAEDTRYYYLPPDLNQNKIDVNHREGIYFLDILGVGQNEILRKVRLITPKGEIVNCEVLRDTIIIDDPNEEMFDGRFNQIK